MFNREAYTSIKENGIGLFRRKMYSGEKWNIVFGVKWKRQYTLYILQYTPRYYNCIDNKILK